MMALRSLLFYLGLIVVTLVFLPIQAICLLLPVRARYHLLTQWGRFALVWLRLTCGLTYAVQGRENIPAKPAIVLAKHQSAWETIALQRIFPPQVWVLKRELLWLPIFGWGLALIRSIAIDRKAGRRALAQVVEQGIDRLHSGFWVVVFPEGTRVAPGTTGSYGIGGALLAEKSGSPVVPVAHNAGEYWPRKGFAKKPGIIHIAIGPPIQSEGRSASEINALAKEWIETRMQSIGDRPETLAAGDTASG